MPNAIGLITAKTACLTNASGKTSLLEAMFLLGRGRSFRPVQLTRGAAAGPARSRSPDGTDRVEATARVVGSEG
jgi:recombinational DNA repair ATPase RecF